MVHRSLMSSLMQERAATDHTTGFSLRGSLHKDETFCIVHGGPGPGIK